MSIIDTIKSRPLLFGGVLVGGVVLLIALRSSGAGQMQPGVPYGSDVGAGDELQAMQLQIQRDISIAGIQAQASSDQTAASLEAARLEYEYQNNAAQIGANVQMAGINATLQALTNRDTLQAQTAINAEDESTARAAIAANSTVEQQRILANALVKQSQAQAGVAQAAIAAQPKQSFWSRIFG